MRDRLVLALRPLVRKVALRTKQLLPDCVELDDLVSDGYLGLMDAIDKLVVRAATADVQARQGRHPVDAEIADEIGISRARLRDTQAQRSDFAPPEVRAMPWSPWPPHSC